MSQLGRNPAECLTGALCDRDILRWAGEAQGDALRRSKQCTRATGIATVTVSELGRYPAECLTGALSGRDALHCGWEAQGEALRRSK